MKRLTVLIDTDTLESERPDVDLDEFQDKLRGEPGVEKVELEDVDEGGG